MSENADERRERDMGLGEVVSEMMAIALKHPTVVGSSAVGEAATRYQMLCDELSRREREYRKYLDEHRYTPRTIQAPREM